MGTQYYVREYDRELGPYSVAILKELASHNRISPETLVRDVAGGGWFAAATLGAVLFGESAEQKPESQDLTEEDIVAILGTSTRRVSSGPSSNGRHIERPVTQRTGLRRATSTKVKKQPLATRLDKDQRVHLVWMAWGALLVTVVIGWVATKIAPLDDPTGEALFPAIAGGLFIGLTFGALLGFAALKLLIILLASPRFAVLAARRIKSMSLEDWTYGVLGLILMPLWAAGLILLLFLPWLPGIIMTLFITAGGLLLHLVGAPGWVQGLWIFGAFWVLVVGGRILFFRR